MARLLFARRAALDLADISDFIGQHNPQAAKRLLASLEAVCRLLASRPMMGRSQADLRPALRSHPHGSYVIFYRPIEGGIEVVRVLHGARDIDAALTE